LLLPVKGLISGFFDFSMDLIENGGSGASPIRTSVASLLPFFFFYVTFVKEHDVY